MKLTKRSLFIFILLFCSLSSFSQEPKFITLYKQGQYEKCLKTAEKVIEKEKGNTTFLDTYGWVLYKRGKLKEAAKVMETVINSGEKPDAVWYEHYGYILKKEKKCWPRWKNMGLSGARTAFKSM